MEFLLDTGRARVVGFVDHEDVGDLEDAGFDCLHVIAHAGGQYDQGNFRDGRDFYFILAYAHGLDDDVIHAGRVEEESKVGGGAGEAAGAAARGHGADKDAGVGVMILHANAIAEDGSAGDAAAGIDGYYAHGAALFAEGAGERIHERALAGAGRSGDAEDRGPARARREVFEELAALGRTVLDGGGMARQSAWGHQLFNNCRAMTRRWISLVPSPIVQSFTSR